MAKYKVAGTVTIGVTIVVEADSEEAAMEKAHDEWPGLEDYCGNGRAGGAIVGTNDENITLDAGCDEPEFDSVEVDDGEDE